MTSTDRPRPSEPRVPPNGGAWQVETRRVSDRNDEARKASREQRAAHEKRIAELKRASAARGVVYR